jgi:hypothetical protein
MPNVILGVQVTGQQGDPENDLHASHCLEMTNIVLRYVI